MNTNRAEYLPHEGVMMEEISSILKDVPRGTFVDSTYGYGSHFNLISDFDHLNFIGFDRDLEAVNNSKSEHNIFHLNLFIVLIRYRSINVVVSVSFLLKFFFITSELLLDPRLLT